MSIYTDAASRPGQQAGAGSDIALFMENFGGMVILARDQVFDYDNLHFVKNIASGKSDDFPIIGRKADASDHEPGELIAGGKIVHDEITITLDKMIYDSAFIPEIDELMNHYELQGPYAHQLGQSLGSLQAKRVAIMHILASRVATAADGQPVPTYQFHANMATSAAQIESALWAAKQYLLENDMSGEVPTAKLRHQQYLLMSRNFGLVETTNVPQLKAEAGSGNRVTGTVGLAVGFSLEGTNHIPSTNITTGLAKYQGDFTTTVGHVSGRMAVGTLRRRAMRLVMKPQEERLGTILIASEFNGHGILRPECSIELTTTER